ncbi:MAG TPA: hypothetical protein VF187_06125, partial [Gemmatimonadales bacterium]
MTGPAGAPEENSNSRENPLVPFLPLEGGAPDPVAISTWQQAVGAATAVDVPHDLFALWLFPQSGGVVLLGPASLARDRVEVPLPDPLLKQDQLFRLEEILRRARYPSAIAVPVRHEGRDVGVVLLGSFTRGAFGPKQAAALHRLAARLTDTMAAMSLVMPSVTPHPAVEPGMTTEELPAHLARAAVEAANGPDLVRRVSGILYPLLPHDRVEILAASSGGPLIPLSGGAPRRRWSSGGGSVEPFTAIVARFGSAPTLLIEDSDGIGGGSDWVVGSGAAAAPPARSVLGARLTVAGQVVGYLLLGSVAGDAYHPPDEDTLALAGLLLAPRVQGLRMAAALEGRQTPDAGTVEPSPLVTSIEALAGTSHLGEALRLFREGLARVLPHQRIAIHLRWGDDEVIAIDPDAPRPFADVPKIPLESFAGAPVIRGDREWLVRSAEGGEEVIVPLAVAGRVVGSLGLLGRSFISPRDAAMTA